MMLKEKRGRERVPGDAGRPRGDLNIHEAVIDVRKREPPRGCPLGGSDDPAMTYSRPRRTTIGPGGLTAVFGMGTGVAPRVWSPGYAPVSTGSGKRCDLNSSPGTRPEGGINAAKRSAVSTG